MNKKIPELAAVHSNFAATILTRAAEIVESGQSSTDGEITTAYDALRVARDEFLRQESKNQSKQRLYGFNHLSVDLRQYIRKLHPQYVDEWATISHWSSATSSKIVARTLREAASHIGEVVAERTKNASGYDLMSEKERVEYFVMCKAVAFLEQEGLAVQVQWERDDPNAPIDYMATVDGTLWAFEITGLRKDSPGAYRKIGHPKSNKSTAAQLEELAQPLPQIPQGPEILRAMLDKAAKHGKQKTQTAEARGAKYCLLVHNSQFLYEDDWKAISHPDYSAFDAVLILHMDDLSSAQVWEVPHQSGFHTQFRNQTISDLADIAEFKATWRVEFKDALKTVSEMDEETIRRLVSESREA